LGSPKRHKCTVVIIRADGSPACQLCDVMQAVDLVSMNASEDDKIKAMMDQSTRGFDQAKYVLAVSAASVHMIRLTSCGGGDPRHRSFWGP